MPETNGQPQPPSDPSAEGRSRPQLTFFAELKRRKVYRAAAAYLAIALAGMEGADLVFPTLGLGPQAYNAVVLAFLLGFPVALGLAWSFDLTGEGIRRTAPADANGVAAQPDRWVRLKAALVGAGFVAVVFLALGRWRAPSPRDPGSVPVDSPVLAVLPFQDISPEGDQAYFADGLHEELLHQLGALQRLSVVPRPSVMHFRGSSLPADVLADSLGSRYLLYGSVRRAADSVRVTARLVDAGIDQELWSESFSRALTMDGLFDLQRTLAMRLVRSLGATLAAGDTEGMGGAPTESVEAYNFFLRGLHHLNTMTRDDILAAADDFQEATELDPEFGQAHAMLAISLVIQNNMGIQRRGELFPRIRQHAELAKRYAPETVESHMAQSSVHYSLDWDWEAARQELEEVLALGPQREEWMFAVAEWYGVVAGDTERALEILDQAERLNPFSATVRGWRAGVLHFGRRYAEAAEEYRKLWNLDPATATNTMNLVSNLALSGQMEEARRLMDEALPRIRRTYGPTLAVHLARVGYKEDARQVWEENLARRTAGASISASGLAAAALAVGERGQALDWLDTAFADEGGIYTLRDPLWDPLRNEPRFQALWDRVGLPGPPPPVR